MVGGLFHFLDLQFMAFISDCGLDPSDLETVRVCFAGRGSTLLKLLRHEEAFKRLVALPNLTDGTLEDSFSEKPKHEAAEGMMARYAAMEDGTNAGKNNVEKVCGITATIGATLLEPHTILEPDLLRALPEQERSTIEMDDFLAFLQKTGDTCGFSIHLDNVARTDIRRTGGEALDKPDQRASSRPAVHSDASENIAPALPRRQRGGQLARHRTRPVARPVVGYPGSERSCNASAPKGLLDRFLKRDDNYYMRRPSPLSARTDPPRPSLHAPSSAVSLRLNTESRTNTNTDTTL